MKRKERRHLKENELVHTLEVMRDFFETRQREVTAAVVAITLIIVAVVGYGVIRQRNQSRGADLLAEAMVTLNTQVVPAGVQTQGEDLPAAADLGATGSFATDEERLLAALPKLQAAAAAYPDSQAGITARYHLASALSALGRHDEAISQFDDVMSRAGAGSLYGRMSRLGKAEAQARGGQLDAAIDEWTQLMATSETDLPMDAILMELARAYVRKGDTEQARKAFTQIVEEHPDSPYTPEARSELDGLEG